MEEARRELGTTLGWTENEWFADLRRREALFDFLQTSGLQLLTDLDALYNDEARLQWVESVRQLAEPPPPAIDKDQPAEVAHSSPPPVSAEQPAAPPASPPKKKSAFKPKNSPEGTT